MLKKLKEQVKVLNYNLKDSLKAYELRRYNNDDVIKQLYDDIDRFKTIVYDLSYNKINQ